MKIHVLSDLHLEFADFEAPEVEADLLVLAGDIHQGIAGIEWAMQVAAGRPFIYVPGNHEYYGQDFNQPVLNIHDKTVFIRDGVRFLGTTLWTDFNLYGDVDKAMNDAQDKMYDYRAIRVEFDGLVSRLTPEDLLAEHVTCVKWLRAKLDEPFDGKTVVVTHHSPSPHSVHERYGRMSLNAAFSSNLLDLVEKADVWIHGHTHDSFDYKFKDCRVVCNPRGYPVGDSQENSSFDPAKVVEI